MTSKFALVIANTEYQDASFAKLTAPGRDAEEFAQVLRELAAFDDVQVLLNEGEGKTRRSIARFFAERKRDDLLLLYFSGHGVRNDAGQLFLAANDTEINILDASGIPADFVTQSMNNSRSQRQLLILDCCNSGAFAHGSKSAAGVGKSMGIASAFEGSGFGRVVLTATDATQYAWEGDKVIGDTQKSVFTHFLIEGLKGEADRDSDGRIHVDELYDYAYEQVVRRTPKQTPGKWSYKQQGDILLRENVQPREVKPAPLPSDLLELLSHPNSSVRKVGIQDLISLLNGKHLGLARGAEEKLREIAENDDSFSFRRTASEALSARGLIVEQPMPVPFNIPEEKQKEEERVEKPIAKPARISSLPVGKSGVSERTPRPFTAWKTVTTKFNLRVIGVVVAVLLVIGLSAIKLAPTLRNLLAPEIGSTLVSDIDGMTLVYVPAGEFTMGNNNSSSDQRPAHIVHLDAFWIDKTEVTNAMYATCVQNGSCQPPDVSRSSTRESYYGISEFGNYPVIYITWENAKAYCEWANRRLPTEAEWEKAARGENAFIYPWGNDAPNSDLLNYNNTIGDTTEVGKYPNGASPYGALDMAGNVWEWVADWYGETYYASSLKSNPPGPDSGAARVRRGGSWVNLEDNVRSTGRAMDTPFNTAYFTGFRCAVSEDVQAQSTPLAHVATNPSHTVPTDTPSSTETSIPPTPVPTLSIGSTMISDKDGMTLHYVPAGEFTMGSEDGYDDEKPIRTVNLDAFWIDQTEVTNAMYAKCVADGSCKEPSDKRSYTHSYYYGNSKYDNYPVIYVDWNRAKTYCEWADRRLPTEAEWEKATRGENANIYPWGNTAPNVTLLNFRTNIGDTTVVGTYPDGKSIYGALDMAGNVYEWVSSLFKPYPYDANDGRENLSDSGVRVLRGGSWYVDVFNVRSASRGGGDPAGADFFTGFRCSRSP